MKKEAKKKATKKVELGVEVEEPKFKNVKEELDYWKNLAEGYKLAVEKTGSLYLNKCEECKKAEEKFVSTLDALRIAYMHIGWFTNKLSWWTRKLNRKKILDMQMQLDNMLAKAEGLDKE